MNRRIPAALLTAFIVTIGILSGLIVFERMNKVETFNAENIAARGHAVWSGHVDTGNKVSYELDTQGHFLDILVLTAFEYENWEDGRTYDALNETRISDEESTRVEIVVPSEAEWHVVLSNPSHLNTCPVDGVISFNIDTSPIWEGFDFNDLFLGEVMMGFFGSVGLAIATRKERRWSKTMIAYLWMRKELLIEKRNNQFTYALTLIAALPLIAYAVLLEGWSPYLLILVGYAYVAAFFPVLIGDGLGRMISHVEATAEDIEMIRESERTATHHVRTCSECGREMLIPKEERGVTTCPNCGKRQVL